MDPDADPAAVARTIVLRQLTGSAKSRLQLADKLTERNVPKDVADAVLDRFEEVHLVDDAEFARMWVRSRAQTRSLTRSALRRELTQKGISGDCAEQALEQLSDDDEHRSAAALVRRKLRPQMALGGRGERDKYVRRLVAMLARKGYAPGLAFGIVTAEIDAYLEQLQES
ncbi:regulatory protein RecX [Paeniglutamicibacter antarcticus]|uniref:Regulatory protein RecX n=1 Tax=Arthrobacter terrae TaxID=2935737 RepID=A0A931CNQ8_9MICC|nr:regulatory protein RecX [Arthrobacter terrae]MBG0739311.1 regulatory protein RecX [Arthrobacter terrae]